LRRYAFAEEFTSAPSSVRLLSTLTLLPRPDAAALLLRAAARRLRFPPSSTSMKRVRGASALVPPRAHEHDDDNDDEAARALRARTGAVAPASQPLAAPADEAARARTCDAVLALADSLCATLAPLAAAPPRPAVYAYNVLDYAREPHERYVRAYGGRVGIRALFLGINPGPFGQVQTGVPFGDVVSVRDWLRVEGRVGAPAVLCPKRPVSGFACKRREVSGQRLWGWAAARTGDDPQVFFRNAFVANYCPVAWMNAAGANLVPAALPKEYRMQVLNACDDHLRRLLALLQPHALVGVGSFAVARLRACAPHGTRVVAMPHPSPASPSANRGWAEQADAAMLAGGIDLTEWR
jgi:single-strand selective monofunctional uracil DNA glycosylase